MATLRPVWTGPASRARVLKFVACFDDRAADAMNWKMGSAGLDDLPADKCQLVNPMCRFPLGDEAIELEWRVATLGSEQDGEGVAEDLA
jgi:hypothetical protein